MEGVETVARVAVVERGAEPRRHGGKEETVELPVAVFPVLDLCFLSPPLVALGSQSVDGRLIGDDAAFTNSGDRDDGLLCGSRCGNGPSNGASKIVNKVEDVVGTEVLLTANVGLDIKMNETALCAEEPVIKARNAN